MAWGGEPLMMGYFAGNAMPGNVRVPGKAEAEALRAAATVPVPETAADRLWPEGTIEQIAELNQRIYRAHLDKVERKATAKEKVSPQGIVNAALARLAEGAARAPYEKFSDRLKAGRVATVDWAALRKMNTALYGTDEAPREYAAFVPFVNTTGDTVTLTDAGLTGVPPLAPAPAVSPFKMAMPAALVVNEPATQGGVVRFDMMAGTAAISAEAVKGLPVALDPAERAKRRAGGS